MFRPLILTLPLLAILLSGCDDSRVKPSSTDAEVVDPHSSEGRAEIAARLGGEMPEVQVNRGDMSNTLQNQLDDLAGRITLVQEQLIQLRSLSQQIADQQQLQGQRLAQLSEQGSQGRSVAGMEMDAGYLEQAVEDIDAALAQLLSALSLQAPEQGAVAAPYRVATAYTRKGWILIRYHAESGETWLADRNTWQRLQESGSLRPSSYEVQVQRADQDSKGYVAVRIDRRDGRSWWLNDQTWQGLN